MRFVPIILILLIVVMLFAGSGRGAMRTGESIVFVIVGLLALVALLAVIIAVR